MKIYTRTGDEGETGLFAGGRISKGHARLHAFGTVDELNSVLGIVVALTEQPVVQEAIERVQADLFSIGADLATPLDAHPKWLVRVSDDMITRLEQEIDGWDAELPPLKNFILPGGGRAGAFLHQARAVCRRAERWIVVLADEQAINPHVLRYINRLSDWLFVLARYGNHIEGETEREWRPRRT